MFNRFRNIRVYNTLKGFQNKPLLPYFSKPNLLTQMDNNNIHTGRGVSQEDQNMFQKLYYENKDKVIQGTKDFINLVTQATKDAYKDAKYLKKVKTSKPKENMTVEEIIESERIKKDLIKFVPFTAAMTLPGGMALLLFIKAFFPRGTPTYFMTEEQIKEQHAGYLTKQAEAHNHVLAYLLKAMEEEGFDLSNKNKEDMKAFLAEHQEVLLDKLDTKKMNSDMLKSASDFLMFEYVEGTYILNTVYKTVVNLPRYGYNLGMYIAKNSYRAVWNHPFFNYKFKLNSTPFEQLKEGLIRRQLDKHLKVLRDENQAIVKNSFGEMKQEDYLQISQERGHVTESEEDAKKWIKKEWTPLVENKVDNEMLTFWYSVIQYDGQH